MGWIRSKIWWREMNWGCIITENKTYMVFDVKQLPGTLWYGPEHLAIKSNDLSEGMWVLWGSELSPTLGVWGLNQLSTLHFAGFGSVCFKNSWWKDGGFLGKGAAEDQISGPGPPGRPTSGGPISLSPSPLSLHLPNVHQMCKASVRGLFGFGVFAHLVSTFWLQGTQSHGAGRGGRVGLTASVFESCWCKI